MVILGQKLKCQKHAKNYSKRSLELFCAKIPLEKNTKSWRNETILKIGHLAKAMAHAKAIYSLWKMVSLGQKLKMPKTCEKPFHKNIRDVLCKKPLQKTPNIREMSYFKNRPSCKGYSPCKGYSLWKMVTLGQKLKMPKTCEKPFHKNIRVVLWIKLLPKNTKYSRNELF